MIPTTALSSVSDTCEDFSAMTSSSTTGAAALAPGNGTAQPLARRSNTYSPTWHRFGVRHLCRNYQRLACDDLGSLPGLMGDGPFGTDKCPADLLTERGAPGGLGPLANGLPHKEIHDHGEGWARAFSVYME